MKIAFVDRFGTCSDDYVHYVHLVNGDVKLFGNGNFDALPKNVQEFMSNSDNFQFRKSKNGEFYHRFS